ncbi:MAG: hypothetical protein N4A74_25580 [Carboxylicivirga sp.]|jgi:hypothetical protein|nr:hypothetical protein [Carboxylicivirga sp.]
MELKEINNRNDLVKIVEKKGYNVVNNVIPIDFYKKEINLVNFAEKALGYNIDSSKVGRYQENQKWFYLNRKEMKDERLEDPIHGSSKIVIGRNSYSPGHKNFRFNGQYYFSQALAHAGDKHGSIVDLVGMHYNTDFRGSLRVIDNFLIHNKAVKENIGNKHIAQSTVDGKSIARRLAEYHNIKPFTDPKFLNSRGINNDMLTDPRFSPVLKNALSEDRKHVNTAFPISGKQGLIGFEIRNNAFKSVLDQKKDGFVRSMVDHTKPIKDLVISESFIDAMSKAQLDNDKSNSLYMSTAGNITTDQIKLIQEILDKGASAKAVFTNKLPSEKYDQVIHTRNYEDHKGVVQKDEAGEPITISYVAYNQPQRLVVGFDNDQAGKMLTTKLLGKLNTGKYFDQDNTALANSTISVYSNKVKNEGRIDWELSHKSSPEEMKQGLNQVINHFNNLNDKTIGKLDENIPFEMTRDDYKLTIRFKHQSQQWDHIVDAIREIKYKNSEKLHVAKAITKDFNEDLKGKLGIDAYAAHKIKLYNKMDKNEINEQNTTNTLKV